MAITSRVKSLTRESFASYRFDQTNSAISLILPHLAVGHQAIGYSTLPSEFYQNLAENQQFKVGIITICLNFSDASKTSLPSMVR